MFNSIKEFAEAMLEGRIFKDEDDIFWFNPKVGFISRSNCGQGTISSWHVYNRVVEVTLPKWYDNIPDQGVLCWVGDTLENLTHIAVVTEYDPSVVYAFKTQNGYSYVRAQPVSIDEVTKFIYSP